MVDSESVTFFCIYGYKNCLYKLILLWRTLSLTAMPCQLGSKCDGKSFLKELFNLVQVPGLVNVDFADVRAIMQDAGSSLMGQGIGSGKGRAREAAMNAISSPLLDVGIERATGIVWNITGPSDMTLFEVRCQLNFSSLFPRIQLILNRYSVLHLSARIYTLSCCFANFCASASFRSFNQSVVLIFYSNSWTSVPNSGIEPRFCDAGQ